MLQRFYKSEPISDDTNQWPIKLVGSEFNKEVIRSKDNYIVLFCNPREKICQAPYKYFSYVANKISNEQRKILNFANFNVIENEVKYYTSKIKQILI